MPTSGVTTMVAGWLPNRQHHAFAAMLVFGTVLSASTVARADCTKDTDCKGDRVCTAGSCVEPASPIVRTLPDDSVPPPPPVVQPVPAPAPVVASTPTIAPQRVQSRSHRDTGISYAGLGLLGLGVLLGGTGTVAFIYGQGDDCSPKSQCEVWKVGGLGAIAVGGIATVIGIVYVAIGSSEGSAAAAPKHTMVGLLSGDAAFRF